MSTEAEAYPLTWPRAKARTPADKRQDASFGRMVQKPGYSYKTRERLTIEQARTKLSDELRRLGAKLPVISTNLRLRNDGYPMSNQRQPEDPGVAVYFTLDDVQQCIAIDLWDRVADNIAAVAHSIDALRGLSRWGGGQMVTAAFSGFKALPGGDSAPLVTPAVMTVEDAARFVCRTMGDLREASAYTVTVNAASFASYYRAAARKLHPDANGGKTLPEWNTLQQANEVLRRHHKL